MCIEFGKKKPVEHIAPKGGIVCYKVMRRDGKGKYWQSDCRYFKYIDGERNPAVRISVEKWNDKWEGNEGYHSFATKAGAQAWAVYADGTHVVQCLIPAGAMYYVGKHDGKKNYISSRIVITGNLKKGKAA